ncbi:hypothetical protein AB0C59_12820 [Streptomyces sp. NPDC048664]|uniref:hypothetical protein n=1 Tax=Streptomyces sp. NPDC048664 TaxID=3154505 RepID=UPI00344A4912
MKKTTARRALRTGVVPLLGAALLAGTTAAGAFAADGTQGARTATTTAPRIVSTAEYTAEGGKDPQSMAPVGEASPARSALAQGLGEQLTRTTGLDVFQAPAASTYETVGQALTFNLGDENGTHPLSVTRLTVHQDVPSAVLSTEGDVTATTTLPGGTTLFTAAGGEGTRVSTLSKDGRLTLWEAPTTSAKGAYTTEDLVRWATKVDAEGDPAAQPTAPTTPTAPGAAAAKPHCQLTHSRKPYLHGGPLKIQADAAMMCDQKGKGNFAASLRQYQGLGIWKTKDVRGYTNEQGQAFPVLLRYTCSRLTTSGWIYRADIGNATLRNSHGYWGDHNVWSETATIHCA